MYIYYENRTQGPFRNITKELVLRNINKLAYIAYTFRIWLHYKVLII